MNTAILTQGSGYWETTDYGFGCCFRRAARDIKVILTGYAYKNEREFRFEDNGKIRTGYSSVLLDPQGGTAL